MGSKPKVVVTRKLPEAVQARLRRDYDPHFNADDHVYSTDELMALADGADALMPCHSEQLSGAVIARLPDSVKAIANFSVGVDHVDLDAARSRGIIVTNTPDVLSDATAEIALLLMLGAARRAAEGDRLIRARQWRLWSPAFMVGTQITGKTLGIIGMGRVGQVTAQRARGFDMAIHYHNRRRVPAEIEQGAVYHESVEALMGACDVLSLHCPATPETRDLINAERIEWLRPGVILVNTARGSLIDDQALQAALRSGRVAAAGLDVYNDEPDIHPGYRELDNTFLLPHIGSATRETRDAMGFRALDNLDAIFAGREPGDRVA
ncbi:MAG: D-glycerate dehydrogenase [Gammaproteobacteria bacterium]|jgi:lactate dehydrogenase-like 2-hydroxyacid dehydrogenase|nr:D-glycerate dehydrogenase [Gammaproteobacteria bacterium]NCF83398.1 D-glycerate dehydrogenase [Pseudomonadota bacterium]